MDDPTIHGLIGLAIVTSLCSGLVLLALKLAGVAPVVSWGWAAVAGPTIAGLAGVYLFGIFIGVIRPRD